MMNNSIYNKDTQNPLYNLDVPITKKKPTEIKKVKLFRNNKTTDKRQIVCCDINVSYLNDISKIFNENSSRSEIIREAVDQFLKIEEKRKEEARKIISINLDLEQVKRLDNLCGFTNRSDAIRIAIREFLKKFEARLS